MAHLKIILWGCFSNLSLGELLIPDDSLHDLFQFKFDHKGDTSFSKHASLFLKFYECYEIDFEYVACIFF